ncbi:HNH endonuclease family protein [Deinococcus radiopugnans]|uniref:HNH endonuclease family protein n=1 Tax=Deinococcus radiopugnans TaxID=57497 RepID=UPI001FDF8BDF|nr:HNH endonuclease family protein [Deinococcus radiopugnans]
MQSLEKYLFINDLARPISTSGDDSLDLLKLATDLYNQSIKSSSILSSLDKWTNEYLNRGGFIANVSKNFTGQKGYYGWTGIIYLLYEYEEYLRIESKNHRRKLDELQYFRQAYGEDIAEDQRDYITIEHIYPQNPSRRSCWNEEYCDYSIQERRILKNNLGNLLPLSTPKNSSLGNRCFGEKKGIRGSTVGYRYGSYSELQVAENDDWRPAQIVSRGLKMLDFMETRWGIKLGTRRDKINILGLSFVR